MDVRWLHFTHHTNTLHDDDAACLPCLGPAQSGVRHVPQPLVTRFFACELGAAAVLVG